ncbi:hypothetical protein ACA910_004594 [Epithemia clementina (nom. ined.)]
MDAAAAGRHGHNNEEDEDEDEDDDVTKTKKKTISVSNALKCVLSVTAHQALCRRRRRQRSSSSIVVEPISTTTTNHLQMLLGRQLAESVHMPEPGYPSYRTSMMDGYCIKQVMAQPQQPHHEQQHQEQQQLSSSVLPAAAQHHHQQQQPPPPSSSHQYCYYVIVGKVHAGDNDDESDPLPLLLFYDGLPTAMYITTGAKVPDIYDTVVPIEECQVLDQIPLGEKNNNNVLIPNPSSGPLLLQHFGYLSIPGNTASSSSPRRSRWIRPVGCDIPAHSVVLPANHVLDSISLGLLHQVACPQVVVYPRIKVGILSTGTELAVAGDEYRNQRGSASNRIPDVNRPMLMTLLQTSQFWDDSFSCRLEDASTVLQVLDLGTFRDDQTQTLVACLQQAKEECDVIITTGGISKGATDQMESILVHQMQGTLHFRSLHMKPGKPTTFVSLPRGNAGRKGVNSESASSTQIENDENKCSCLVFALPGNPVSAFVCAQLLVLPCLQLLVHQRHFGHGKNPDERDDKNLARLVQDMVQNAMVHTEVKAQLSQHIVLDLERPEYHRVILSPPPPAVGKSPFYTNNNKSLRIATSTGTQQSSRLLSLRDAHGLALLPQGTTQKLSMETGDECTVLKFWPNRFGGQCDVVPSTPTTVATSRHLNPPFVLRLGLIQFTSNVGSVTELATSTTIGDTCLEGSASRPTSTTTTTSTELAEQAQKALTTNDDNMAIVVSHVATHFVSVSNSAKTTAVASLDQPQYRPSQTSDHYSDLLASVLSPAATTTSIISTELERLDNQHTTTITTSSDRPPMVPENCDLLLLVTNVESLPNAFEWHSQIADALVRCDRTRKHRQSKRSCVADSESLPPETSRSVLVQVNKLAPALAIQVRQGASMGSSGVGGVWEVVVGRLAATANTPTTSRCFGADQTKADLAAVLSDPLCLVVLLSDQGFESALRHASVPLKHAAMQIHQDRSRP